MKKKLSIVLAIMLTLVITAVGLYSMNKAYAVENDQIKPIHSYTFDNDNGSSVIDTGSMAGTEGKFNGVANGAQVINEDRSTFRRFNGTSDHIQFNDKVIPMGKKSIRFKIRTESKGDYKDGSVDLIFSTTDHSPDKSGLEVAIYNGSIGVSLFTKNGSWSDRGICLISDKKIADNEWHDILFTWDGNVNTDTAKLYIDNLDEPDKIGKVTHEELPHDYSLSTNSRSYLQHLFKGDLDDIEIYDEVVDYTIQTESITLDKTAIDLLEGNTDKLTATVLPEDAVNKKVVWSSSDETIATVDEEGNVSAIKVGQADITAKVDGTNLSATCKVIVTEKEPEPQPTPGKAILSISLVDGKTKDYDISMEEVDKFINWYETKASSTYKFDKNISPYKSVKEYIVHDKITSFEVREYE